MHLAPRRTLAKIVEQYGEELIDDPRRTEALLNDLCGKYTREIFVLIQAQRRRVPIELRDSPAWMPTRTTINRLTRRLESQRALAPEAAAWAVESWAMALGLLDDPGRSGLFRLVPGNFLPGRSDANGGAQSIAPAKPAKQPGKALLGKGRQENRKPAGQYATSVVKSGPRVASGETGQSRLHAMTADAQARLSRLGRYVRKQAPGVLLWSTVLGMSLLLGWAILDGADIPGSAALTEPENSSPTAVATLATDSEPPPTFTPEQSVLAQLYAPPQVAWVTAGDGLHRRQEPSLHALSFGVLTFGQMVSILGYSPDGRWAQLDAPFAGWVSTDYLALRASGNPTGNSAEANNFAEAAEVRIFLRSGRIQPQFHSVAPRQEPSPNAAGLEPIQGGVEITIVAVTLDEKWYQIGRPVAGWLMREAVDLNP